MNPYLRIGDEHSSANGDRITETETAPGRGLRNDLKLRFLTTTACPTVAYYPLLSLERALKAAGIPHLLNPQSEAEVFAAKAVSKLRLIRNLRHSSKGPVLVGFMGFSESKTLPFSYWTEIVPYCFDCWPASYERWASFFIGHHVRLAFFSARQSADYFGRSIPRMKSVWLPEATDSTEYNPTRSWSERDIDVLELGRRAEIYHNAVAARLAQQGRSHLFERVKGEIIFPTRAALVDGLSRSRISVCFPCSQTHPERSGTVETVTHRYFESMAARCLIIGHAPQELIDLFGYNPVVEAEANNEAAQIEFILLHPSSFQSLVDRNYGQLLKCGTWTSRVSTILDVFRDLPALVRQ